MNKTILVVDDNVNFLSITSNFLRSKGFTVLCATDGITALDIFRSSNIDIIILDMILPYKDGLTILTEIRQTYKSTIPIIMNTALNDESYINRCFHQGANDYIIKPFDLEFLAKKIKDLLINLTTTAVLDTALWHYNHLEINFAKNIILSYGKEVNIGRTRYEILKILFYNKGTVLTRNQIIDYVWGTRKEISDRTIDSHISRIKKDLLIDCIKSVPGYGYVLSF